MSHGHLHLSIDVMDDLQDASLQERYLKGGRIVPPPEPARSAIRTPPATPERELF